MATQTLSGASERTWDGALWVVQAGLAGMFSVAGAIRAFVPIDQLKEGRLLWADASNEWWLRGSGYALMFAAVALVLPPLLKVAEKLVPAVAVAMALSAVVTMASHVVRGMGARLAEDVFIAALCVFVAWGRVYKIRY
jgi:hypothetical protein